MFGKFKTSSTYFLKFLQLISGLGIHVNDASLEIIVNVIILRSISTGVHLTFSTRFFYLSTPDNIFRTLSGKPVGNINDFLPLIRKQRWMSGAWMQGNDRFYTHCIQLTKGRVACGFVRKIKHTWLCLKECALCSLTIMTDI